MRWLTGRVGEHGLGYETWLWYSTKGPFIEVVMSLKIAQSEWFRETFNQVNQILDLLNP